MGIFTGKCHHRQLAKRAAHRSLFSRLVVRSADRSASRSTVGIANQLPPKTYTVYLLRGIQYQVCLSDRLPVATTSVTTIICKLSHCLLVVTSHSRFVFTSPHGVVKVTVQAVERSLELSVVQTVDETQKVSRRHIRVRVERRLRNGANV